ncbi:YciI family protein [Rhodococcus koreensis]|uniref:YciI family protein n=1 Tax=Rhodococcus sp. T2V TaxID=3034164 RepID=UPI0023E242A0|nr:YciI family protein [Rhodococcus sp. T2V]MDF3310800.1 YciI family protein [Rhodococcus sp. T2V]
MTYFVVDYTYTAETASGRDTHRAAHRAWLGDLVDTGTVLTCGPYGDDSGAFIIAAADTADTVRQLLTEDPFVVHGLVPAQRIVQWTPVLGALSSAVAGREESA